VVLRALSQLQYKKEQEEAAARKRIERETINLEEYHNKRLIERRADELTWFGLDGPDRTRQQRLRQQIDDLTAEINGERNCSEARIRCPVTGCGETFDYQDRVDEHLEMSFGRAHLRYCKQHGIDHVPDYERMLKDLEKRRGDIQRVPWVRPSFRLPTMKYKQTDIRSFFPAVANDTSKVRSTRPKLNAPSSIPKRTKQTDIRSFFRTAV